MEEERGSSALEAGGVCSIRADRMAAVGRGDDDEEEEEGLGRLPVLRRRRCCCAAVATR